MAAHCVSEVFLLCAASQDEYKAAIHVCLVLLMSAAWQEVYWSALSGHEHSGKMDR